MSKRKEQNNIKDEELKVTPSDTKGNDSYAEDEKAIEAIKKFTQEEDEDESFEVSFRTILGGDFLQSRFFMKQVIFVIFCVVLMIIYTGNRYDSQQDAILIDSLRNHLQEVKYNVLTQSTDLLNETRQSNVEKRLRVTSDSTMQSSTMPPYLIKMNEVDANLTKEKNTTLN